MSRVIYTAIFGGKDVIHEQEYRPDGFDFICFTDDTSMRSDIWDIRIVEQPFQDPVRSARYYKICPHLFLPAYDQSVWIDGNMIITGDVGVLLTDYLTDTDIAVYDHTQQVRRFLKVLWVPDHALARNCIYAEAASVLAQTDNGRYVDDPERIRAQIARYRAEKYPEHNGLALTTVVLRNHMKLHVIDLMEAWWRELVNGSRRDQLSFNYVAWKHDIPFAYIAGDPRYGEYFNKVKHARREHFRLS